MDAHQNVAQNPTPASLKLRVAAIRGQLPGNVRQLVREQFTDLDTAKGSRKIDNVLNGGSSDPRITSFLESLVLPVAA
jgi:hypothetical protein